MHWSSVHEMFTTNDLRPLPQPYAKSGIKKLKMSSFTKSKFKNHFLVNCDVTHDNWTLTSYVAVRVLVRVYMHDVTSHVSRHQKKVFEKKVEFRDRQKSERKVSM